MLIESPVFVNPGERNREDSRPDEIDKADQHLPDSQLPASLKPILLCTVQTGADDECFTTVITAAKGMIP
jgi:hypothetical protein